MGAMTPTPTGIATPAGLLFRVRATGAIDVEPNPAVLAGWGANAIGAGDMKMARPTGPAGNQYGFLKLKVSLQTGSLAGIDLAPVGGDSTQVERVVFAPNAGTLIAERTYIGGEISCNSPGRLECPPLLHNAESALEPFWKLQGQHVVEAELLAAELTLRADQRTVTPHRVVTFTAGSDPVSVPAVQWIQYGIIATAAVPLQVTQWRWVPDRGAGQTVACTHTQKVCSVSVEESGTMYVDALVNGEAKSQPVNIGVLAGTPHLVLEPDSSVVTSGSTVAFRARAEPDTLDGYPVLVENPIWRSTGFSDTTAVVTLRARRSVAAGKREVRLSTTLSGAEPPTCADGADVNPCWITVYTAGSMEVEATLRGNLAASQAKVFVQPLAPDEMLDESEASPPDCAHPAAVQARAFCNGSVPDSLRRSRLRAAIDSMRQLGGPCVALADRLDVILRADGLRIYRQADFPTFGGAAASGGDWLVVSDAWTDQFFGSTTTSGEPGGPRNLQHTLAHEADHLLGRHHLNNGLANEDPYNTPNSRSCSGIPSP